MSGYKASLVGVFPLRTSRNIALRDLDPRRLAVDSEKSGGMAVEDASLRPLNLRFHLQQFLRERRAGYRYAKGISDGEIHDFAGGTGQQKEGGHLSIQPGGIRAQPH